MLKQVDKGIAVSFSNSPLLFNIACSFTHAKLVQFRTLGTAHSIGIIWFLEAVSEYLLSRIKPLLY